MGLEVIRYVLNINPLPHQLYRYYSKKRTVISHINMCPSINYLQVTVAHFWPTICSKA